MSASVADTSLSQVACPVCNKAMRAFRREWLYKCEGCGMRVSTLEPRAGDDTGDTIDEAHRLEALRRLREANFKTVLGYMQRHVRPSGQVLDVGSAHGWFIEAGRKAGFDIRGIEPDAGMYRYTKDRGLPVTHGFFPRDLEAGEQFDAIVFNDVFEHIPAPDRLLSDCVDRLRDGGILVLNLPSSSGVFYRLAETLAGLGWKNPLDRMWQKNFASPHVTYFQPDHLVALGERAGLKTVLETSLPSVTVRGLWERLRYDKTASTAVSAALWLAIASSKPILAVLPADIALVLFRKGE